MVKYKSPFTQVPQLPNGYLTPNEQAVLLAILRHDLDKYQPRIKEIAATAGVAESTVKVALKALNTKGILLIAKKRLIKTTINAYSVDVDNIARIYRESVAEQSYLDREEKEAEQLVQRDQLIQDLESHFGERWAGMVERESRDIIRRGPENSFEFFKTTVISLGDKTIPTDLEIIELAFKKIFNNVIEERQ